MSEDSTAIRTSHQSAPPGLDGFMENTVRTNHTSGGYQVPDNTMYPGISFPDPGPQFVSRIRPNDPEVLLT